MELFNVLRVKVDDFNGGWLNQGKCFQKMTAKKTTGNQKYSLKQ